jgi:hypothetical protein
MGTLGARVHYNCRDCGAQWSTERSAPEECDDCGCLIPVGADVCECTDADEWDDDDDPNACADCERSNGPGSRCECGDRSYR